MDSNRRPRSEVTRCLSRKILCARRVCLARIWFLAGLQPAGCDEGWMISCATAERRSRKACLDPIRCNFGWLSVR